MAFYINNMGELANYTDCIDIMKILEFTTSGLFVVIFAFNNGIMNSWKFDYFKLKVGLNSFYLFFTSFDPCVRIKIWWC